MATEDKIAQLEERVRALELRLASIIQPENSNENSGEKLAVGEFLKTKVLSDDVKRTLAIAYWLDYFDKLKSFNVTDIESSFRAARLAVPKNINDKINMNIRNGHIAEEKEKKNGKKAWYITNTGVEFVENNLSLNR